MKLKNKSDALGMEKAVSNREKVFSLLDQPLNEIKLLN